MYSHLLGLSFQASSRSAAVWNNFWIKLFAFKITSPCVVVILLWLKRTKEFFSVVQMEENTKHLTC